MKVALYQGIKSIKLDDIPDPKATPGEVIVKVKYCGICGTEVHSYHYEELYRPGILGHEIVGTIVEVGAGIKNWHVGDRVAGGRGGFAEYIKVQNPEQLFKVPEEVTFEDAVLWDPISVPIHGIRQSRFQLGDSVVVAGVGSIGLSAIQLLKMGGAKYIIATEPNDKKLNFALTSGADIGFNPLDGSQGLNEKIIALCDGSGADVAFECAGNPLSFRALVEFVKHSGQILLLGVTNRETPLVESELIRKEIDIKASLAFHAEDVSLCFDFLSKKRFDTKGMISDIIPLTDIVKAMERLNSPQESLIKIIVAP